MLELSDFSNFDFIKLRIAAKILLILSVIVVLSEKLFNKLRSIDESILSKNMIITFKSASLW